MGETANNYFWRTYAQHEIDLVEERDCGLSGFEMKWGNAKPKPPKEWTGAYPQAAWQVIERENYLPFIGGRAL